MILYQIVADYSHCTPYHPGYYTIAENEEEALENFYNSYASEYRLYEIRECSIEKIGEIMSDLEHYKFV